MERGYSDNREQDSDYESDCGTSIPGLSIENDFGVGSLLPIATRMRESFAKAMERNCDQRYYASVMIVNESKKILKKKFTIFKFCMVIRTRLSGERLSILKTDGWIKTAI